MGALNRPEYDSLEDNCLEKVTIDSETSSGAFKHNESSGLIEAKLPGGQGAGQARLAKPATTMANTLFTQADSDSEAAVVMADDHELLDALMGKTFEEKPVWSTLWESIQDVFFPRKLPPLVLTSTPIPVPDKMAVKPNPWAIGISTTVNLTILLIFLFFLGKKIIDTVNKPPESLTSIDVGDFNAAKAAQKNGGGGGGGEHSVIEASKGKLPKIMKDPIVPPMVQTFDKPKIVMPAAIDVQKEIKLPDNPDMPTIGMKSGVHVVLSNGTGGGGGMGSGSGGGLGSGNGIG